MRLITIFTFCISYTHAQNLWVEKMQNHSSNFYEVQSEFENYWSDKTIEKGKGWKPYKRWESFIAPRVFPDGNFPEHQLYEEWNKIKYQAKNSNDIEANWNLLGPSDVPLQSSGRKRGVGRLNVVEFHPNNPNIIWVGAASGGLWKSVDGGQNWTTNTDLLPNLGVSDIAIDPLNPNIMYIATGDRDAGDTYSYGVMKSIDGGETWNSTSLTFNISNSYRGNRILINPNNTNVIIISLKKSGYGYVYRSEDGGESWTQRLEGPNIISMEFKIDNPNIIYGVTTGSSKLWKSFDNGINWENVNSSVGLPNSGNNRGVIGLTPANPNTVYILYSASDDGYGGLYKSTDGGLNFTMQSDIESLQKNLLGWDVDGSDEGGQGWYDLALAVSPTNENLVFVGGVNVWKSTDSGQSFNISSHWYGGGGNSYMHADEHMLRYNSSNNILYSANDGGLYFSDDDGEDWTDISDGLSITQFYKIGISQTNEAIVLGGSQDNGTLLKSFGDEWTAVLGGDGMECAVDPTNENIMYGESYYGSLQKSTNGGENWESINPDDEGAWITPYQIDQTAPNRIVIGYNYVYESFDYGENWETISGTFNDNSNLNVIALCNSDVNTIYVSSDEEIYKTNNGGDDWTNISSGLPNRSVTCINVHPEDQNRLWVTFSGYSDGEKVFYSENGGENWSNISSNLPNLPANAIVFYQPNETLFAGTDVGVWYKDSSMTEWSQYNQGLPNVIVNELEIHTSANKLFAATYGRGLWATALPNNVPPIANFNYTLNGNCTGELEFISTSSNADELIWNFGDNQSETSTNNSITHQYQSDGQYVVELTVVNQLGSDVTSQTIDIDLLEPPTVNDASSCLVSSLTLSASTINNQNIFWYDENGVLVGNGTEYETPELISSTTYFAQASETLTEDYTGAPSHSGNSDYSGGENSVGSLVFDAYDSFVLKSVDVYTNQSGNRKILLLDANNNIIHEHLEDIPISENTPYTIELDFFISEGENYKLATDESLNIQNFGGTNPQLKRTGTNGEIDFPYVLNNTLSINYSFWQNDTEEENLYNYYYYFYNWKIQTLCNSASVPVTAHIGSGEELSIGTLNDCAYDSVQLVANGNFVEFQWQNNNINNNSFTALTPGTYVVTAFDSAGCVANAAFNLLDINSFSISTGSQPMCENNSIILQTGVGFDNYEWNNGETGNNLIINESGTYSVTATDANGCIVSDEIVLNLMPTQQVSTSVNPNSATICQGEQAILLASGSAEYIWDNSTSGSSYTVSPNNTGNIEYVVIATDENGCVSSDTVNITVLDCSSVGETLEFPVVIFPNPTDGNFVVKHQSNQNDIKSISIFDVRSRLMLSRETNYTNGYLNEQFNISSFTTGMYFIQLVTERDIFYKKIVLE